MLQALADGETNPAALATLAAPRLRATPEQLCDAFQASATLHPVYRRLLTLTLEELRLIEDHLGQLDQLMADLLTAHHDAVQRLAEVPGLGVDSAQQIIAEVGATAATFPSSKHLASWTGACPGNEESAGVNYNRAAPKAIGRCDASSTKPPTPRLKPRGRSLPSSTVGSSHASDMPKRLGPSPTGSVD
jgi:transposase